MGHVLSIGRYSGFEPKPQVRYSSPAVKAGCLPKYRCGVEDYKPKINLRRSVIIAAIVIALMALAAWLLAGQSFRQMFNALSNADRRLIAAAIAVYFLSIGLWAFRWQTALSFIHCRVKFLVRYLILCATIFLNNITPGARIGGDPFGRLYMLHKLENTSYSLTMASLIGDRTLTPLIIVSFMMAGLLLRFGKGSLQLTIILAAVWAAAAFATVFFPRTFFRKRVAVKGISGIVGRVLARFGRTARVDGTLGQIETFYSDSYATLDSWKKISLLGSLTLLLGALDVFRIYVIFLALGYHPQLSVLLIASSLPTIVGLIPFLPGGLVIVEGSLVSVFTALGVPLDLALAATVLERGISFVLATIVGGAVFSYLGVRMAAKREVPNGA
jgi:glycosyltransferase 2 family protein